MWVTTSLHYPFYPPEADSTACGEEAVGTLSSVWIWWRKGNSKSRWNKIPVVETEPCPFTEISRVTANWYGIIDCRTAERNTCWLMVLRVLFWITLDLTFRLVHICSFLWMYIELSLPLMPLSHRFFLILWHLTSFSSVSASEST